MKPSSLFSLPDASLVGRSSKPLTVLDGHATRSVLNTMARRQGFLSRKVLTWPLQVLPMPMVLLKKGIFVRVILRLQKRGSRWVGLYELYARACCFVNFDVLA